MAREYTHAVFLRVALSRYVFLRVGFPDLTILVHDRCDIARCCAQGNRDRAVTWLGVQHEAAGQQRLKRQCDGREPNRKTA